MLHRTTEDNMGIQKDRVGPFYRSYPVLFGVLIACAIFAIGAILLTYIPSTEPLLDRDLGWVRFVGYTVPLFLVLIFAVPRNRRSPPFWEVLSLLFAIHITCFVVFFHYFRQLTGFEYCLYCIFEYPLLKVALQRGTSFSAKFRSRHEGE